MLSGRRAEILGLVIEEYISTATPVSSQALVVRHRLGVSSATVRNELARLEDDGYITHPHTSAGRVPSDLGYRVYVEALMPDRPIPADEQRTIEHQFHQVPAEIEEWLRLASTILAAAVNNVAVISRPRRYGSRLRQVQLVHLAGERALLVAVLDDGGVQERIVLLAQPEEQDELAERARRLNSRFAGLTAEQARAVPESAGDAEDGRLAAAVIELVEAHDAATELFIDGLRSALEQPEFASSQRMLEAVRHLDAYELGRVIPPPAQIEDGSANVMIGGENPSEWMQDWSLIAASFGDADGMRGTIAVLGPTRMRYGETIPRVRYVASLVGSLLKGLS